MLKKKRERDDLSMIYFSAAKVESKHMITSEHPSPWERVNRMLLGMKGKEQTLGWSSERIPRGCNQRLLYIGRVEQI